MTDGTNNNDPQNQQPGWGAPEGGQPYVPPTQPPVDPFPQGQTPPPPAPGAPGPDPYAQQGYQAPNPYGQQGGYPPAGAPYGAQPKKKRKLWLWITLAIVIPLFLCGLGITGLTVWVVGKTKPAVDATNNFYKAAQEGKNLDSYTCQKFLDQDSGGFTPVFTSANSTYGRIKSYDFTKVTTTGSLTVVTGRVTRNLTYARTEVDLVKENGKFKVCEVLER